MNKKFFSIVLYIIYSLPYVYFGMYQDFTNRSMLGHALVVLVSILIPILAKNINVLIIVTCNIISFIISSICINYYMGGEGWLGYFKPLTPIQFLVLITIINITISAITLNIVNKSKLK